jgi:PAS domain S-box-containing protein
MRQNDAARFPISVILPRALDVGCTPLLFWEIDHRLVRDVTAVMPDEIGRFHQFLDKLPTAAYSCDREGLITYFNPRAVQVWGRAPVLNNPVDRYCGSFRLYSPQGEPIAHDQCWMARALHSGQEYEGEEIVIERPDGSRITALAHASPVRNAAGEIAGAINMLVDISDRQRAESTQRLLTAIVESSEDAIYSRSLDGTITSWNPAAERLFGYSAAEIVGTSIERLIPPERRAEEDAAMERIWRGERIHHYETVRHTKAGQRIEVSISTSQILDESGRVVGASKVSRDITAAKRAADELRNSEERFARFTRHLPGLAWIKDLDGRYLFVNDAVERAFQKSRWEICGRTDDEIFPPATAAQFCQNDRLALKSGAGLETVETLLHDDGILHHSLVTKFPIPGPDGNPALIGGMAIDITARMQAEEALRDADRRKDEFLATLAHELRNPLAPLSNSLQILRLSDDLPPAVEAMRDVMQRQVDQLVRLVDDLLEVSRITRGKVELRKETVELARIVATAVETSRPLIEAARHQLAVAICSEPLLLDADPVRLSQVISNLLNNAAKYTDDGGQIWLTARAQEDQAVISVRDTGNGIPPEMLPRVFDMFAQLDATLRRAQGGMGIGLTLARTLVEMHGGRISAHSEGIGCGSEFTIRLPLVAAPARIEARRQALPEQAQPVPAHKILVVDDAPAAAQMLARLLERLGQEVRTAHSAAEALERVREAPPEVVISDLGMPHVDGLQLARQLRMMPAMRRAVLVALTGYGQESDRQSTKEAGFDQHLVKPVSLETLRTLLASLPQMTFARSTTAAAAPAD